MSTKAEQFFEIILFHIVTTALVSFSFFMGPVDHLPFMAIGILMDVPVFFLHCTELLFYPRTVTGLFLICTFHHIYAHVRSDSVVLL